MSYQDYQYSWPGGESYDYSYSSPQYPSASNSQGHYTPTDQYSPSTAQQDYQYEASYTKPPADSYDYNNSYSIEVSATSNANIDPQYAHEQFSASHASYSNVPESNFQSTPYPYSHSQFRQDPPSSNQMTYSSESTYNNSSYQYSEPPNSQMETGPSYSGDVLDPVYAPPVDHVHGNHQHSIPYVDNFSESSQYIDQVSTPTSSDTYYGIDNASSGTYPRGSGVDVNHVFSDEFPSNSSGVIETIGNFSPHKFETSSQSSYGGYSYRPRGHVNPGNRGSAYRRQGERRPGYSTGPRGGRMNSSTFPSSNNSSYGFGGNNNTYGNTVQGTLAADTQRDGYRGNRAQHAVSASRFANSRSRAQSLHSSNAGHRGSTSFPRSSSGSRFISKSPLPGKWSDSRGGNQQRGQMTRALKESNFSALKPSLSHSSPALPPDSKQLSDSVTMKGQWKTQGYSSGEKKKEVLKAPSRPQDKLLNEIEEKEKEARLEKERKVAEEKEKAEKARKEAEEARRAEEEAQQKIMEEARRKTEEMARKLAPPGKPPETPEEIAKEEEIQRKIRESVVVVDPVKEMALLTGDPVKDMEMPQELREILKTLTSGTFCKLCSLKMFGPHMAPMHYNGKNHLKKVRTFVQTNGRSAGFNMETLPTSEEESEVGEKKEGEAEADEEMEVDEKKYCKLCKVSFSHGSQYEMHYKGKNHAKKVRSLANSAEIFECKICCVTVTAQEHLTAHLNGARHKLQVRKNSRGSMRGQGSFYARPGRGGLGGRAENGTWKSADMNGGEPSEFNGRGRFDNRGRGRGRGGFKRPADQNGFGFIKRPRY